jgi:RNase H-fold protein (predicted Holliday junction resolvase)
MDIKNKKGNRKSKKEGRVDHKAASMILKTFLERVKK